MGAGLGRPVGRGRHPRTSPPHRCLPWPDDRTGNLKHRQEHADPTVRGGVRAESVREVRAVQGRMQQLRKLRPVGHMAHRQPRVL